MKTSDLILQTALCYDLIAAPENELDAMTRVFSLTCRMPGFPAILSFCSTKCSVLSSGHRLMLEDHHRQSAALQAASHMLYRQLALAWVTWVQMAADAAREAALQKSTGMDDAQAHLLEEDRRVKAVGAIDPRQSATRLAIPRCGGALPFEQRAELSRQAT